MTLRVFCQSGTQEMLKGGFHAALLTILVPIATYNALAWLYRRDPHLLINAVGYGAGVGLEVRKLLHHLERGPR